MNPSIPTIESTEPLFKYHEGDFIRDENGAINPFHYDSFHMGTPIAKNVMIFHTNHSEKPAKYLKLVNLKTGEQVYIKFPENWQ